MSLLTEWRQLAYNQEADPREYQIFWNTYFEVETGFYKSLLAEKEEVKGTIPELQEKYGVDQMTMVGMLDGINDSLVVPNPIEEMDETTVLSLNYDKELLYKNMVINKAEWLYTLEEWNDLIDEDRRAVLYKEAKLANTVIKDKKIGRNDPCPCGSGKKYKKCCGKNL